MASVRKKIHPSGRQAWEARVIIKGFAPLSKSFEKKSDAVDWANQKTAILRGGGKVSRLPEKITIAKVIEAYRQHNTKRSTPSADPTCTLAKSKQYALEAVAWHVGERTVHTLTRNAIQDLVDKLLQLEIPQPANKQKAHPLYDGARPRTYSGAAVRKIYYALKTAVEWHATEHDYPLGNKFEKLTIPAPWVERTRRLEDGEEAKLLAACDGMYKDAEGWKLLIRFALESCMRAGELLGMQWDEVNLQHRFVSVPRERAKTRTGRQVPLSSEALLILRQLAKRRVDPRARVFASFPAQSALLSRGFKRITKRAGVNNLRFHDLRHEATSRLFERTSLQTMEIALMTGHTQLSTLQRYANLRPALMAQKLDSGVAMFKAKERKAQRARADAR